MIGERLRALLLLALLGGCTHPSSGQASIAVDTTVLSSANLADSRKSVETSTLSEKDKSAFLAQFDAHKAKPKTLYGKTVRDVINDQKTYDVGLAMAAQARRDDTKHRTEMAALLSVDVLAHRDEEHQIILTLRVHNKSRKVIRRLENGLAVTDPAGARVGLAEFVVERTIAPQAMVTFQTPLRYLKFGEDAGTMRLAQNKPKQIALEVKEVKFAGGTDAGYDD